MLTTSVLLCIIVLLIIFKAIWFYVYDIQKYPPGPLPLPLIGNKVPKDVHPGLVKYYLKLRDIYGNIYTVYHGMQPNILVNGVQPIMELLLKHGHVVHTRHTHGSFSLLHDNTGLVWNNNAYKRLRRISSEAIKIFLDNQRPIESELNDNLPKLDQLLMLLENNQGEVFDLREPLRDLVSFNICSMLFGSQYKTNCEEHVQQIMKLHYATLTTFEELTSVSEGVPYKYLPRYKEMWSNFTTQKNLFNSFMAQEITHHRKEQASMSTSRDFIDVFLRHSAKADTKDTDCQATAMQMMLAGLDAVYGCLQWLVLYCVLNPEIQTKMAEEIYNEIGDEVKPGIKHLAMTPYCHAVIDEVIRITNIAFTSLPYQNSEDIIISGVKIPKDSRILVNLTSIHQDPELFPEPQNFKPERFLDADGKLKKLYYFMPFSIGRRSCIGETFSKSAVFEIIASIIQRYHIEKVDGEEYSTECESSLLSIPKPYKVKLVHRKLKNRAA